MKKKIILPAAILLALSLFLTACQTGSKAPAETIPAPSVTQTTPTEPIQQAEPTENQGEPEMSPVEQPETNEEVDVGNLLTPDETEGNTPPTEEEVQQPTEPTAEPTEPGEVPEETLPITTQPPNDGYSSNWY